MIYLSGSGAFLKKDGAVVASVYVRRMIMIQTVRKKNMIAMLLIAVFLLFTAVSDGMAHRRPYRHHHSRTKGAVIGGVAGAVAGGLIGGKKGAAIGAGVGAGGGYVVQRHRNRRHYRNRRNR